MNIKPEIGKVYEVRGFLADDLQKEEVVIAKLTKLIKSSTWKTVCVGRSVSGTTHRENEGSKTVYWSEEDVIETLS